jgi:hypothetical protein
MQAIGSPFMLCAFALVVTVAGVSVKFELGNGEVSPNHTLDSGNFGISNNIMLSEGMIEESEKPIHLDMIWDENMLAQLKRFWHEDVSEDIGPDQLSRFIRASNSLVLRGYTPQHFPRNMAKKVFLGSRSSAILRMFPYIRPQECWDISWPMFIAFAEETGSEIRMSRTGGKVTLCSKGNLEAETYGVPASPLEERPVVRKLTVRCGTLGGTRDEGDADAPNGMVILAWFMRHLIVPSLSIDLEFELTSGDIRCFAEAIYI